MQTQNLLKTYFSLLLSLATLETSFFAAVAHAALALNHFQDCAIDHSSHFQEHSPAVAWELELWLLHAAAEPCQTAEAPAHMYRLSANYTQY